MPRRVSHTAGVSYKLPDHPVTIAAGYELSWLDGVRDSHNATSASGTSSYGDHKDSLLYHGPFVRLVVSLP